MSALAKLSSDVRSCQMSRRLGGPRLEGLGMNLSVLRCSRDSIDGDVGPTPTIMPPRIPLFQCLKTPSASVSSHARAFTTSASCQASTKTQRRRGHDPYAEAQARARKAANLSRQEVLKQERASALGDPVRGQPTAFVQSFDTGSAPEPPVDQSPVDEVKGASAQPDDHLNFFLNTRELQSGIQHSKWLSTPPDSALDYENETSDETSEDRRRILAEEQSTAEEAMRRISSLSIGSSKDRLRVNVQRCIDTFGRHNTDLTLPDQHRSLNKSQTLPQMVNEHGETEHVPSQRAGPDTGSSEVQIAILTAKIKTLADYLETRGTTDKVNKRNLRLLVHRRQKLLQYLRRKERGGPRWQRVVETLGLTEGTWKGEISM